MSIPLANALLCMDCERVVESRGHNCPDCGSTALMPLANVLGLVNTSLELNSVRKGGLGESPEYGQGGVFLL